MNSNLRKSITEFLKVEINNDDNIEYQIISEEDKYNYTQILISYTGIEDDDIKAFLLVPKGSGPFPAVLVHHQHNSERFFGKSEVCGIVGDTFQAFGPALADEGIVVLAPDSICFEDRRINGLNSGVKPHEETDFIQHYNEMCYRLLKGETLQKKVLEDASIAISLLRGLPSVDKEKVGVLGHSYGGNTVLFQGAIDCRIKFACSSGAACSYKNRMQNGTGIEMASVIPGFNLKYEIEDLVKCFAPRELLLLSATEDKYSKDGDVIFKNAIKYLETMGFEGSLKHMRYEGGHALDKDRFKNIVQWILSKTH